MTIQSLGNTNNIVLPPKPSQNDKTSGSNEQVASNSRDNVEITTAGKEITKTFESSKTTSPVNQERIDAIKLSLEEGSYSINAEQIAEKMIHMER
ncbi:MAG: flagellar biosynthesis anti-sigma factor FlgM [Methylococcales bacterium]|nr:flagellar biosynthesis anti-sigma factor FlgM [Methylococcales bacterium]